MICTGGNDHAGADDKIELKVFNDKGELVARRYFSAVVMAVIGVFLLLRLISHLVSHPERAKARSRRARVQRRQWETRCYCISRPEGTRKQM
jgi:hypothetical protein